MQTLKSQVEIIISQWAIAQVKKANKYFANFKYFSAIDILREDQAAAKFEQLEDEMIASDDPNIEVLEEEYDLLAGETFGEYNDLSGWVAALMDDYFCPEDELETPVEDYLKYITREFKV